MQSSAFSWQRHRHDDEDDSHTTLSRGGAAGTYKYEKDEVESISSSVDLLASPPSNAGNAITAATSPATASLPSITSPSIQTLNILSQHDALGGGNLRYDREKMLMNHNRNASSPSSSDVGIVVTRKQQRQQQQVSAPTTMTTTMTTRTRSKATTTNIKARRRPTSSSPTKSPNKSSSVVVMTTKDDDDDNNEARHRHRTTNVHNRPKRTTSDTNANANEEQDEHQAALVLAHKLAATLLPQQQGQGQPTRRKENVSSAAATKARVDNDNNNKSTTPPTNNDIVPFCKACRKQQSDVTSSSSNNNKNSSIIPSHHALCPKHPQFDNSGAREKLHWIRRGMTTFHCLACAHHYQHGRIVDPTILHSDECPRRTLPLRQNGLVLVDDDDNDDDGTNQNNTTTTTDPTTQTKNKRKSSSNNNNNKNESCSATTKQRTVAQQATTKSNKRASNNKTLPASSKKTSNRGTTKKQAATAATTTTVTAAASSKAKTKSGKQNNNNNNSSSSSSQGRRTSSQSIPDDDDPNNAVGIGASQGTNGPTTTVVDSAAAAAVTSNGTRRQLGKKRRRRDDHESIDGRDDDDEDSKNRRAPPPPPSKRTKGGANHNKAAAASSNPALVETTAPSNKRTRTSSAQVPKKSSRSGGRTASKKNSLQNNSTTTAYKSKSSLLSNGNGQSVKPNWVPCENPWGPSGFQDGDVVLVDPSGGFTHHETMYGGERFTVSPFGPTSDYGNTHRPPSEGLDVILLARDPTAQHPWGFTYRRHEFGGACLVSSVDPLSPAATAVYRGNELDSSDAAGLRIHDMILSINGKPVGGMTELGVAVEFDVCGREMELVVARYRDPVGAARQVAALERSEWTAFDDAVSDKCRLDWFEMNGNSSDTRSLPTIDMLHSNDLMTFDVHHQDNQFGATGSTSYARSPMPNQICFQNKQHESPVSHHLSHSQLSLASPRSLASRRSGRSQRSRGLGGRSVISATCAEDDNDDEAWLGCVCGEIHPEPIRVFWIQCDECKSWYNVAPACVGFNEFEASTIGSFVCRACEDSVVVEQASVRSHNSKRSVRQASLRRGSFAKRLSAVPRNSLPSTPASTNSRNVCSQRSASEILEDRNKRRTDDGFFLPLRSPRRKPDGTYARPCGRAPPGMVWDNVRGVYAPQKAKSKPNTLDAPKEPKTTSKEVAPSESSITPSPTIENDIEPRIQLKGGSPSEPVSKPSSVPPRGSTNVANVQLEMETSTNDAATLEKHSSSERSMTILSGTKPSVAEVDASRAQLKDKETSDNGAGLPSLSPADVTTDAGPRTSSKKPKRGSRLEREAEREKRTTNDGCLLPNSALNVKEDGTYARPRGRGPAGWFWDADRGVYAPPKSKQTQVSSPNQLGSCEEPKTVASKPTVSTLAKSSTPTASTIQAIAAGRDVSVTLKCTQSKILPVGSLVTVAERMWSGSNKAGGVGTVTDFEEDGSGSIFYDVKYALGGREKGIEHVWVSPYANNLSSRRTATKSN